MADQIYLHLWIEQFHEDSMLEFWGKLLEVFPASAAAPDVRGVAAIPFTWGEAAAVEQVFAEGASVESTVALAREFLHPDYAYQAALRWDMWRQKTVEELTEPDPDELAGEARPDHASDDASGDSDTGADEAFTETLGWKRVPLEVTITCLGPEFDRPDDVAGAVPPEASPHFKIDLGLDTLFLPEADADESAGEEDWEEAALCYRDNITQLLNFLRRIEKTLPLKSRLLWSSAGDDLGERIRQAYGGA